MACLHRLQAMKKALAIVAVLLLGFLWLRTAFEPLYLNLTDDEIVSRVRVGMSRQEVHASLGEPAWTHESGRDKSPAWNYYNSTKTLASSSRPLMVTVIFENGVVAHCLRQVK